MKSSKKKIIAAIVAVVAVVALPFGVYKIVDNIKINNAIDEVTGNKYVIKDDVVYYDGEKNTNAEVVQYEKPEDRDLIAHIYIKDYGKITVRFFPEQAPLAVENFVTHAKEGYYDGLTFHRIFDEFMIQGGDPEGIGSGGESIWKNESGQYCDFEDEFSKNLIPIRGALCMANAGTNTNGSQFFIVQQTSYHIQYVMDLYGAGVDSNLIAYYKENGGSGWLYGVHTVFGQVVEGYDVLDKVAAVTVDSNGTPENDVIIEKIELDTY